MTLDAQLNKSIVIIEDHPSMRFALKTILATEKNIDIVGEASNGREGMLVIKQLMPDLIILDLILPDVDGLDLVVNIKKHATSSKILILSSHEPRIYADKLASIGCNGYISKSCTTEEILNMIRAVLSGYNCFPSSPQLSKEGKKSESDDILKKLTHRELTIFLALARGRGNKDIALALNISEKTVGTHKLNIKRKLNLNSSVEIASFAILNGLINGG
jgi:DNA-binding NarL/FixJ family response regulator